MVNGHSVMFAQRIKVAELDVLLNVSLHRKNLTPGTKSQNLGIRSITPRMGVRGFVGRLDTTVGGRNFYSFQRSQVPSSEPPSFERSSWDQRCGWLRCSC